MAIRRSPNARRWPSPDEVKAWMASGVAPTSYEDELDRERCPSCGRAGECVCPNCEYCVIHGSQHTRRRTDPTGTEE